MSVVYYPPDVPTEQLPDLPAIPAGWRETDAQTARARTAWQHTETGLRVWVRTDRRPRQMHTPKPFDDDLGYVAEVTDGDEQGALCFELSSKPAAYEAAIRFMATYERGDFEFPAHDTWSELGPLEW